MMKVQGKSFSKKCSHHESSILIKMFLAYFSGYFSLKLSIQKQMKFITYLGAAMKGLVKNQECLDTFWHEHLFDKTIDLIDLTKRH